MEAAIDPYPPNYRYESTNIGTWSSVNDVDTFFTLHNHNNGYSGLKLGNIITINDGTYNVDWEIAGFDCEYNRTASDGTAYNNGYGICMIPKTSIGSEEWNSSNTVTGGYMSSTIHVYSLVEVANNLKNVLGSHLVLRNVLLSSGILGSLPNAFTWTTSYAELMSYGQLTGMFMQYSTIYDDGEANYKLPLFNYEGYMTSSGYWLRSIWGRDDSNDYCAWLVRDYNGRIYDLVVTYRKSMRPLIYIR